MERTASRNVRDITPSPPPQTNRTRNLPLDRRPSRRSYDNDWKGKGKALSRKHSDDGRADRDRADSRVVSSRYNSEERELARHIRDSRNSSRERQTERVDFHHSNMKRLSKKPTARSRSPSPSSPSNKYTKYKDSTGERSKKEYFKQRSSGGRSASSMMDNDWDTKKFKDSKRDSRGSSRTEARRDRPISRDRSPRGQGRDRDGERESGEGRDKRKKDRRSTLSEEEEEILNSLIAMRRVEKSRQRKQRRTERGDSDSREPSRRERSDKDKRKRKRKHSKQSTEDSSDDR